MRKTLTTFARDLRKNQTPHEAKLWSLLRNRKLMSFKFRRQYQFGGYIADFCCLKKKLIIELDGNWHNQKRQHNSDKCRDAVLENSGYTTLRISNHELDNNPEGVISKITEYLRK